MDNNKEALGGKHNEEVQPNGVHISEKLGIVRFLRGKVLLVTGATGFLGKALVEKILRTIPDVDKIYLLMRAENKDVALERLKKEIINTELFDGIHRFYGKTYEKTILGKLIPIVGEVNKFGLGMEINIADIVADEVDIIINSAANTNFDERYDVALDINTLGPCRLLSFAKRCKKLSLFMHISTAYANGKREGIILEKKFKLGDSIAREQAAAENPIKFFPPLDVDAEIKMALNIKKSCEEEMVIPKMKQLGHDRARIHGWQDVYVFTKAMGEMMIEKKREKIPIVIIRPSIIESTCKEPMPGWFQGVRMMDPIILTYGIGELTGFPCNPSGIADLIPVDMVVNAILAATAKHGRAKKKELNIYHICSSVVNPMTNADLVRFYFEYFQRRPCMDSENNSINIKPMILFNSLTDFQSHVDNEVANNRSINAAQGRTLSRRVQKIKRLANVYEPYTIYGGRFDNSNMKKLMEDMSEEERKTFNFDVASLDWKNYICNIHLPSLMGSVKEEMIRVSPRM